MLHFLLPVLSIAVCFLSPFPDSLPQPFLRCLLSHFPLPFRFLSSSSDPLPATQPVRSSYSIFLPFSPRSWLFRRSCSAYAFQVFPLTPSLVSHAFFPVPCTRPRCMFPFVLPCFAPTAVPQVLTIFRLSTSLWCFPLLPHSFVRFRLGSDYSASVSSFPFFPIPPHSGLIGAVIHLPCRLFPCVPSDFGTQPSCNSFLRSLDLPYRCSSSCRPPVASSAVPLAYALGYGYLAG